MRTVAVRKKKTARKKAPRKKKPVRKVVRKKKKTTRAVDDYVRCTDEDCVETAATMMARRVNRESIRRVISLNLYGGIDTDNPTVPKKVISEAQLDRYIAAATRKALDTYRRSKDDSKALAIQTYEEVIRDPDSKPGDRINAQRRIDELMGHDYRASGDVETPEERAARFILAVQKMDDTIGKPKKK